MSNRQHRGSISAPYEHRYDLGRAPSAPPYRFSGVTLRVLPLRARFDRLQVFCEQYLNVFPDVARFRPLDGFVELVVLEYPRMTSVEQPAVAIHGQIEVFFLVSVSWKDMASGKTRIGVVTPYIFVDNPISARLGRDVFGWPKEAAWYHRDSSSTGEHFAIDQEALDQGGVRVSRFLEVRSLAAHELFSFGRPKLGCRASSDLDRHASVASRPLRAAQRGFALWQRAFRGALAEWRRPTEISSINLKQMPQLEPAGTACYQALTVTPLRATRVSGFGLIGERRQLLGDPSGGCRVRVYEDPTWPVVTQLGLDFDASSLERGSHENVAYDFEPVFPLWLTMDLEQFPSRILASRGTPARVSGACTAPLVSVLGSRRLLGATRSMSFRGVRAQLFVLAADVRAHQRFAEELDALDMGYRFALPESTLGAPRSSVVMTMITIEGMSSAQLSLSDWRETLVEFYVPIGHYPRGSDARLATPALFARLGFTTSSTSCNAIRDCLGGDVVLGTLSRGERGSAVLGLDPTLHLLQLATTVVPHFQLGELARSAPVLDIYGRPRARGAPDGVALDGEPMLAGLAHMPVLRLKQVPSAEKPHESSYRALVRSVWSGAQSVRLDAGIDHELCFHRYESLPIADHLGLSDDLPEPRHRGQAAARRPVAEAIYTFDGEVTLQSEVLWERLWG